MFKIKHKVALVLLTAGLLIASDVVLAEPTQEPPAPAFDDETVSGMKQEPIQGPPVSASADGIVSKMKEQLNLSEEQVSQIKAVIEDNIAKIQAAAKQNLDTKSFRDKMVELQKDMESKISQYLTSSQLIQWKNRKLGHPERRMGPPPADKES